MAETLMKTPQGEFEIQLNPPNPGSSHRGWDSADQYLLEELADQWSPGERPVLILNDSHGALTLALKDHPKDIWQDSHSQRLAINQNMERNGTNSVEFGLTQKCYELVLIKIPKTISLLEYQLRRIRNLITEDTLILGAGMARHIHKSTLKCFSNILGPVHTSKAQKKARLIFCKKNSIQDLPDWQEWSQYEVPGIPKPLQSLPHVFSRDHLDRGTALLLKHLPAWSTPFRALDYGCGNGVIAIYSALRNPQGVYQGVDDSLLAVESARENVKELNLENRVSLIHGSSVPQGEFDLILSNPPFHQGQRIDLSPARKFFRDAAKRLSKGGKLLIVANRHLGYHKLLGSLFPKTRILEDNAGYLIIES